MITIILLAYITIGLVLGLTAATKVYRLRETAVFKTKIEDLNTKLGKAGLPAAVSADKVRRTLLLVAIVLTAVITAFWPLSMGAVINILKTQIE